MSYMLDTNICIYLIKNKPLSVFEHMKAHIEDGLCISAIVLAEMEHGVCGSAFPAKATLALKQFLAIVDVLSFDGEAAAEYGKVFTDLRRKGTPIGPMDTLIAAHALASGKTLVTNNIREFERVEGLALVNWAES